MNKQNISDIFALSPMQEGVLFHSIDTSKQGVYFNQYSCSISVQPKDNVHFEAALDNAWQKAVERHGVLRTFFTWEKRDKPLQIVRNTVPIPFVLVDWSQSNHQHLAVGERVEKRIDQWLQRDRDIGFELEKAPLSRITLIKLSASNYRMIWSFHHLILDGWSVRLILSQIKEHVNDQLQNRPTKFASTPDFRSFIAWHQQRNWEPDFQFWRDALAGFELPCFPEVHDGSIMYDHQRAGRNVGKDGGQSSSTMTDAHLDEQTHAELQQLAKVHQVTLNSVLSTAWAILLARYCDASDVVFGTTVAGRSVPVDHIAQMTGLFINTLPTRVRIEPDDTVAALFKKVQSLQLLQREHEQSSLAQVQRCSELPSGTPLFETIVVFESFPDLQSNTVGSISNTLLFDDERFIEYSNFPLALLIVPEKGVQLIAVHDQNRLSVLATQKMLMHFEQIVRQMLAKPLTNAHNIKLLTPSEQALQCVAWNDRHCPPSSNLTVIDLIEQHAANSPEAVAVVADRESLTFAKLNQQANRIAHDLLDRQLTSRGVIVVSERNSQAIIGLLAALKAGTPYVMLDAKDAFKRLPIIVNDFKQAFCTGAKDEKPLVLIDESELKSVDSSQVEVVLFDANRSQFSATNPSQDGKVKVGSNDLAYIIYTSGSSGRPKGVMMSHRSLYNSTQARLDYYTEPLHSFALLSSLSTDSAIAGIYWALCCGGTLIMPASRAELEIDHLAALINKHRVTHTLCVPSLYSLILEHANEEQLRSLTTVIVAGEAAGTKLISQHFALHSEAKLYNEYGPSETCVWASVSQLQQEDAKTGVTIGKPIRNTQIYICDQHLNPMPIGVAGELCIGGDNVANGYLAQEALSEWAFVADPFSSDPRAKLYRTGDRARFRADGAIEFLGRLDGQLKVRGYRVEPGEVEAVLCQHPDVRESIVLIDDSAALDGQLRELMDRVEPSTLENLFDTINQMDDEAVQRALLVGMDKQHKTVRSTS